MRLIALLAVAGTTACNPSVPPPDPAFCRPLFTREVEELADVLTAHPETPDPVGEEATDVVLAHRDGCRSTAS